jgi:hypothetical protein
VESEHHPERQRLPRPGREHEFDGKAKASLHGCRLDTPELRGDTGMLEAGFTLNPTAKAPLTLDVGVQGNAGKREG